MSDLLAGAIAGWLAQLFGAFGLQAGSQLIQGSDVEKALRQALAVGMQAVVTQVPGSDQEHLAKVLKDRFSEGLLLVDSRERLLDTMKEAVQTQLAPLADPTITPSGSSYLEEIGVDASWLNDALLSEIIKAIRQASLWDKALMPVVQQLDHDRHDLHHGDVQGSVAEANEMIKEIRTRIIEFGRMEDDPSAQADPVTITVSPGAERGTRTTVDAVTWVRTVAARTIDLLGMAIYSPSIEVSDTGNVAVVTAHGIAHIYDCATGRIILQRGHLPGMVRLAAVSPAGDLLVTATNHSVGKLWRIPSGERVGNLLRPGRRTVWTIFGSVDYRVRTFRFNGSGQRLAVRLLVSSTGGQMRFERGWIQVWDTSATRRLFESDVLDNPDGLLEFSDDGSKILVEDSQRLLIYDLDSPDEPITVEQEENLQTALLTKDGRRLVTIGADTIRRWEPVGQSAPVSILPHSHQLLSAAVSHDGRYAATGGKEGWTRLWDLDAGEVVLRISHSNRVGSVTFSPNGRLWALASGRHVNLLEIGGASMLWLPHDDDVASVRFSSDGKLLFTVSGRKVIGIWTLHST